MTDPDASTPPDAPRYCWVSGKRAFGTKEEAFRALMVTRRRSGFEAWRTYFCVACGSHHLSHRRH